MSFQWKTRTSLFARMSLLFGLLVTFPLVISGIVLSLAGWNSVRESGDEIARAGITAVDASADQFQRTAEEKMRDAGKNVAKMGRDRLETSSKDAIEAGKDAFISNAKQMTTRGQQAVTKATGSVVKAGEEGLRKSLDTLGQTHRDSLDLLASHFRQQMEDELKGSATEVREGLATSSGRSWELSADRRLTAVQDMGNRIQNQILIKLQYPLATTAVLERSADSTPQIIQTYIRKNENSIVRVVLVDWTGTEVTRVPETDLPDGDDAIDWSKKDTRERQTWDGAQNSTLSVYFEPAQFDERNKVWIRRLVQKFARPSSREAASVLPEMSMDPDAAPQPMPFLLVDFKLDGLVMEAISQELQEGMDVLVIQEDTGKIVSCRDAKQINTVAKDILEVLPMGKEAAVYSEKSKPFSIESPQGKILGRARYWPQLRCWVVVTQPEAIVQKPVTTLETGIRQAWQTSLNKVKTESDQFITERIQRDQDAREKKLIYQGTEQIRKQEEKERAQVARDLKGYQNEVIRNLDAQIAQKLKRLQSEAGVGMDTEAAQAATKAFQEVKTVSDERAARAKEAINVRSAQVAKQAAGKMLSYSAWLIPLFLVLALFLATMTARSLVRPINQLVKGTQALAAGDYSRRIKIKGGDDELARLAFAFNDMAGAIESGQAQLQQSHDNLATEKARIQGIVESSPDGLVMLEPTGQVAFINLAAIRLLELAATDIPAAPFEVAQLPSLSGQRVQECLERAQGHEGVQEYEWHEPQRRVLQLREVKLRAENGRSYGRLLHIHDITRERVIDEMKSDFISLVSHELRTPLTSILGFSSYMLTGRLGAVADTQKTALESIHRQAKRLSAIISDFLDVSRIESGKIEMKKEPVQVKSIASRVVEDLRPQATEKQVQVSARVEEGTLPLVALGDEQRIAQVFTNLIGNALKFTEPSGAIDVSLHRKNGEVVCKVRDTGCGIPPDELDRVFDRFYQVEKVVTRKTGGTGLGLAIVKNIVEAHGGRIWIESRLGEGTEVSFTLPGAD